MTPTPKLGASPDDYSSYFNTKSGEFDLSCLSSTFSMFIWGLVMAKAKTGFSASGTKDKETVG